MAKLFAKRLFVEVAVGIAILIGMTGLVCCPQSAVKAAKDGLTLCFNVIVPNLFPFFVVSSLLVEFGLAGHLGRLMEPVMRPLFNVNGACASAFVLGFVGGYPVGARTAISLYERGQCSEAEAERLLSFCNNSGPAFILGVVGAGIFANSRAGVLLYLSHALASVAVGIIFSRYRSGEKKRRSAVKTEFEAVKLSQAFSKSVMSSFSSTMAICAFVVFFTVAIRMLFQFGVIQALAGGIAFLLSPLGFTEIQAQQLLTGLIEVSSGIGSLQAAAGSMSARLAMAAFMLGWAGISVHCQVLSFIGSSGLSTRTYIAGKLLHGGISAAFAFFLSRLFSFEAPVSSYLVEQLEAISGLSFSGSLLISSAAALALFAIFLLVGTRRRARGLRG